MMLTAALFDAQMAALPAAASVQVADLSQDESITAMAQRLLAAAPDRFAAIGLSMGGIVALEVHRLAPQRITHLALLDTTPHADSPQRRELRNEQVEQAQRGQLRELLVESLKPLYLAQRSRGNQALLDRIVAMGLELGPAVFRRQSLALRDRQSYLDTLSTIRCPSLVLCGREDSLCPVDLHVDMAARIRGADLVALTDCGHLSTMEQPAAVTQALLLLLGRTS